MAKVLLTTNLVRKKGFLYYCGTSKDGKIQVCQAQMKSSKKKK